MKYNDFSVVSQQSLHNIVSDMTSNDINNLKEYLKIVLKQPGLKLQGDNFKCSLSGDDQIVVNVGPAVFDNYEIFVPQNSTSVELDLSKDYDVLFVYLVHMDPEDSTWSFPISRIPEEDPSNFVPKPVPAIDYAYENSSVELIVASSPIEDESSIIIATVELDADDNWNITANTQNNRLRMVQNYPIQDWAPTRASVGGLQNVVLETFNLASMKRSSFVINGVEADINSASPANDLHQTSVISISWDPPPAADLAILGPIVYYKVILTPQFDNVDNWHIDHTVLYDGSDDRIFCNIPCATGVTYDVDVVRINDLVNGGTLSPVYNAGTIVGGLNEEISTSFNIQNTINIDQAFGAGAIYWMKPEFSLATDKEHYVQLFVKEIKDEDGTTIPTQPETGNLCRPQYLYYSGHAQKQLFVAHPDTVAIYACARLIGPGERIVASTPIITCNIYEPSTQYIAWTWPVPNLGALSANDIFVYTFTPERSFVIRRLMISGHGGETQAGYVEVYVGDAENNQYVYYDAYGNGDSEYDDSNIGPEETVFPAGEDVHIWIHGHGGTTNPAGCIITMVVEVIE